MEDPEVVYLEEQQQEFEVAEQVEEPVPEANFANSSRSQASTGSSTPVFYISLSLCKPRFILTSVFT